MAPAVVNVPLWAAQDAHALDQHGLELEVRVIGSTEGTSDALMKGDIDVAFATPDPALSHPDQVEILAGLVDRPPLALVCRKGITSFADLRGAAIGTTSLREGTVQLIRAMLGQHDLHFPTDYDLVLAGAHPQRWQALQEGSIDAAMQLMPFDFMAAEAGYPVLGRAEDVIPYFAFGSVCVRRNWSAELKTAFRTALVTGERSIRHDRERAAHLISQQARVGIEHAQRCVERLIDGGVMPVDLTHCEAALDQNRRAIAELSSAG